MVDNELAAHVKAYCQLGAPEESYVAALNAVLLSMHGKPEVLLPLVASLGDVVNAPDPDLRRRGMLLLAVVLQRLPDLRLNDDAVATLCQFFRQRLLDTPTVLEVVRAQAALVQHHSLTPALVQEMVHGLFTEVQTPAQPVVVRMQVYQLLLRLLERYLEVLRDIAPDVAVGVMQAVDGERDARALALSLRLLQRVVQDLPDALAMFVDDVFEVSACYFPINFRNRSQADLPLASRRSGEDLSPDSYDALQAQLRDLLTSSDRFAPHLRHLLLEKLDSSVASTRQEALLTLEHAAQRLSPPVVASIAQDACRAIDQQLFRAADADERAALIRPVGAIVRRISGLPPLLAHVTGDILPGLRARLAQALGIDPDQVPEGVAAHEQPAQVIMTCGLVLESVAEASVAAYQHVAASIMPFLLSQVATEEPDRVLNVQGVLALFSLLLRAAATLNEHHQLEQHPLQTWSQHMLAVLRAALYGDASPRSVDVRCTALTALARCVAPSPALVPDQEAEAVASSAVSLTIDDRNASVRANCATVLQSVRRRPDFLSVLQAKLLPPLLAYVRDADDAARVAGVLGVVQSLCDPGAGDESAADPLTDLTLHICDALVAIVSTGKQAGSVLRALASVADHCVSNVYLAQHLDQRVVRVLLLQYTDPSNPALPEAEAVLVVRAVIAALPGLAVLETVRRSAILLLTGDAASSLTGPLPDAAATPTPSAVSFASPGLLALIAGVLTAVPADLVSMLPETQAVLSVCRSAAPATVLSSPALAHINASLINKMQDDQSAGQAAALLPWDALADSAAALSVRMAAVTMCMWCLKALAMRGHADANTLAQHVVSALQCSEQAVADKVTAMFAMLLHDSTDGLSARLHCRVRGVYKQKFFVQQLPGLIAGFRAGDAHCLVAVSHLLQDVPQAVMLAEVRRLLPVVLDALSSDTTPVLLRLSCLHTLCVMTRDAPDVVAEHVNSVQRVITPAFQHARSARVRCAALSVAAAMPGSLAFQRVYPLRTMMIRDLAVPVDDPRRAVRYEAALARNAWCALIDSTK